MITVRHYDHRDDYERVGELLLRTYRTHGEHVNWVQPRWEYMHYHPLIRDVDVTVIGVWENQGEIVAVVHPEHCMGIAYLEIDPEYTSLKEEMVGYAETHLSSVQDGVRTLRVYVNDGDEELRRLVQERGYTEAGHSEPMSQLVIPDPFPPISLPGGFRLKSLAEENDLWKADRVLYRGFDHGEDPPGDDGMADRAFMQSAPNFRKDLNVVVEAPDGQFVSYCGMWLEGVHQLAYVEPVATDPDYRRRGLGRAAVLEGVRRCGALGARVAWVGSAQPFYESLGFRQVYDCSAWQRAWKG